MLFPYKRTGMLRGGFDGRGRCVVQIIYTLNWNLKNFVWKTFHSHFFSFFENMIRIHYNIWIRSYFLDTECDEIRTVFWILKSDKKLNIFIYALSYISYYNWRGRGMGRGGPMNSMPRGFSGPPNMRRGMLRGLMPRGMGFRYKNKHWNKSIIN